jgi:hypothetical protein
MFLWHVGMKAQRLRIKIMLMGLSNEYTQCALQREVYIYFSESCGVPNAEYRPTA